MELGYGSLRGLGINSFGWFKSSTDYMSAVYAGTYYFDSNADLVATSGGPGSRWYGFPVRCLVY